MFSGYNDNFPYSKYTDLLARGFPKWTKIRKDPNSIGRQFLNVFGLMLQDVEVFLDAAFKDQYIESANEVANIDHIYKVHIGDITKSKHNTIIGDSNQLKEVATMMEFYSDSGHVCIIDYDRDIIYLRNQYSSVTVNGVEYDNVQVHTVWNVFDSFALLLGMARRPMETNSELKQRILDCFKYPGNSTKLGLIRALGKELGLIHREIWEDTEPYFTIDSDSAIPETIIVNGSSLHASQYEEDETSYKIYPRISAFYRDDMRYDLHGVHIDADNRLVLNDDTEDGYALTGIIYPSNLKQWTDADIVATGDVEIDIVGMEYETIGENSSLVLHRNIGQNPITSLVTGPIRLLIRMRAGAEVPVLESVILHYEHSTCEVEYIYGIDINSFSDSAFRQSLYNDDGMPSRKLLQYVDELNKVVPITWGRWKWDESYWDIIDKNLLGLEVLPNRWDPQLGEVPNIYSQTGIGDNLDCRLKFDDSWHPMIHSGRYFISTTHTLTCTDATIGSTPVSMVSVEDQDPEFITITDAARKTYKVMYVDRDKVYFIPRIQSGSQVNVTYMTPHYIYIDRDTITDPGPVSEIVLNQQPRQGAPVIVIGKDSNGKTKLLRHVAFLDEDGVSIVNTEEIAGTGSNIIYLTYDSPVDLTVNGVDVSPLSIDRNKVWLPYTVSNVEYVTATYKLADSFTVSGNTVTLSDNYTDVTIYYERSNDKTYYEHEDITFNPVESHITDSFLYITAAVPTAHSIRANAFPDAIRNNGVDYAIIHVDVFDRWGNPVCNKEVTVASVSLARDDTGTTISPGTVTPVSTYYNRHSFRYVGPDPEDIPGDPATRKIPCTATITFQCESITTAVSIRVR